MNSRRFSLIIMSMFIIALLFTLCSSEYNRQIEEYDAIYDKTMSLLDSENVYGSIKDNNLTSNLDDLNKLLKKIEENLPNNKIDDFLVLRTKHNILKRVIEGGLKWDSLDDLDRLSIKNSINRLKPK